MLTLVYDPSKTTVDKVQKRILDAGHDVENKKAKDIIYKSLPECCYYRDMKSMDSTSDQTITDTTTSNISSKNEVKGVVLEEDNKGSFKPLAGATVRWVEKNSGTVTDENGVFTLKPEGEKIIISYTGFKADTISVTPARELNVVLASGNELK